ncbi:MAG: FkbM family methyltransferase, partial [Acidobacteria bacterium]|nr:FkbM family methyltransferase [Acidobacteriota bacterium]
VDRITPLPVALSDRTGLAVFSLRSLEPGSARHTLGDGPSEEGPPVYRQPVMTFRLDDLIDELGVPPPNHIKLDVDGGELAVLGGASRALASPSLRSLLIEVSASMSDAITEVLCSHGLRLHSKVDVQNKAGDYLVWYGLFTRNGGGAASGDPPVEVVSR